MGAPHTARFAALCTRLPRRTRYLRIASRLSMLTPMPCLMLLMLLRTATCSALQVSDERQVLLHLVYKWA
ncbi:hypothetical protein [Candidatus Pantoea persica]|uniref:hypothetical protein n=1 Tax=Candidatus Pantoea persica TaxID=2518128 RepID=UPI00215DB35A|nr:hypothetical protein [Candidatus Pantoea persica]